MGSASVGVSLDGSGRAPWRISIKRGCWSRWQRPGWRWQLLPYGFLWALAGVAAALHQLSDKRETLARAAQVNRAGSDTGMHTGRGTQQGKVWALGEKSSCAGRGKSRPCQLKGLWAALPKQTEAEAGTQGVGPCRGMLQRCRGSPRKIPTVS